MYEYAMDALISDLIIPVPYCTTVFSTSRPVAPLVASVEKIVGVNEMDSE
jgi:hypothetical protein